MTPTITATELRLRYGRTTALDGLTLSLDGPRIHGLIGRNGSGKTSLLSVLAGFRPASAGTVHVDGQPVFENAAALRQLCLIRGSGDTVEHNWPDDKLRHALKLAADLRPNWDADYAAALVERFALNPKKRLTELSTGQRSAVGVVPGLAARAPVTIFDESYLGMDAPARYTFYDELLNDYMEHPRTIIVSSHLVEEVSRLFESVVLIHQGRLLLHEDAETLRLRGAAVTGEASAVNEFVATRTVLGEKRLGRTLSTVIYGELDETERSQAQAAGLVPGTYLGDMLVLAMLVFLVTTLIAVAMHLAGNTPSGSGWVTATTVFKWILLGFGIYLTTVSLPELIAHGRTRREFTVLYASTAVLAGAAMGTVVALGYQAETWLYSLLGAAQELPSDRGGLYGAPHEFGLIAAEYALVLPVWLAVGGLLGAGFYRGNLVVLGFLPVGVLVLWTLKGNVGTQEFGLPWLDPLPGLGFGSVVGTVVIAVALLAVCLVATWFLVRAIPLRSRPQ